MSHQASLTNHNPTNYSTNASFVYSAQYTSAVLSLLDAKPGEKIIDLGCGTAELTNIIKGLVGETGEVVGVDSSEKMLVKAKENSSHTSIQYIQADIQSLPTLLDPSLKGKFDAVFSSATFHWAKSNPGGVIEGIKWLLKPGGRIAFEFGGFGNAALVRSAMHQVLIKDGVDPIPLDPWYFPTDAQYASLLREHGLITGDVGLFPRPTPLPTDLYGWMNTFVRNTFLADYSQQDQDRLMTEVQEICRPGKYWNDEHPGVGIKPTGESRNKKDGWQIMYVRLRGTATKPAD